MEPSKQPKDTPARGPRAWAKLDDAIRQAEAEAARRRHGRGGLGSRPEIGPPADRPDTPEARRRREGGPGRAAPRATGVRPPARGMSQKGSSATSPGRGVAEQQFCDKPGRSREFCDKPGRSLSQNAGSATTPPTSR